MISVRASRLPEASLLHVYRAAGGDDSPMNYTDCYAIEIPGDIRLAEFVVAFYTTPLFKLERWILHHIVQKPSTDTDARQLGDGQAVSFSAWRVEARTGNELLMCDLRGRTRSWFMVDPIIKEAGRQTVLRFGSAVVGTGAAKPGPSGYSLMFRLLIGFHKVYSRALLASAGRRLRKAR